MTTIVIGRQRALPRAFTLLLATTIYALLSGSWVFARWLHFGSVAVEDDAWYYKIIARNLVHSGVSTFDGQTLTNGYHPLWLLAETLQEATLGSSMTITVAVEVALATASVWLFLAALKNKSLLVGSIFAVLYAVMSRRMVGLGMEVSLLLFTFALFVKIAIDQRNGEERPIALGLAASLVIFARLDAAVFVLPMLFLASRNLRSAAMATVPLGLAGAAYVGVNLVVFGLPFPVSGAIKSLGGLQINHPLLAEATADLNGPITLKSVAAFLNSYVMRPVLVSVLVGACSLFATPDSQSRALRLGFLAGFLLFAVKLVFFSSWLIWSWYAFPELLGLVMLLHLADERLAASGGASAPRLQVVGALTLLLGAAVQTKGAIEKSFTMANFDSISRQAITRLDEVFGGARVAMGDRAGSFAAQYEGPVTQLEGIVNDKAWFKAMLEGADPKPLLCARGVRFVLSYQRDLGDYTQVAVPLVRAHLSQHRSQALTFSKSDEVDRVFDLSKFDNSSGDEGDNYLYVWRLSGCNANHS